MLTVKPQKRGWNFCQIRSIFYIGIFFSVVFFVFVNARSAQAAACVASTTGNWSATSGVWTSCQGGGTSPPISTDSVTVNAGVTLTVDTGNPTVASLAIASSTTANQLAVSTGQLLTITGALSYTANASANTQTITLNGTGSIAAATMTVNAPTSTGSSVVTCAGGATGTLSTSGAATLNGAATTSGAVTLTINTCTFSTGGLLTMAGGSTGGNISIITTSTGTLTNSAGLTCTGTAARDVLTIGTGSTWNFAGTMSSGCTPTINSGSTEKFTSTTALNGAYTYGIVQVNTGTTTISGATTIAGTTLVADGATLSLGTVAITFTGAITVGAGTSGIINTSAAGTGNKTFSAAITVNAGGNFDLSASTAATTSFAGGTITNNSSNTIKFPTGTTITITGTGTWTLTGSGIGGITWPAGTMTIPTNKTISNAITTGTVTIPNLTIATSTAANGMTLATGTNTTITGTLTFNANASALNQTITMNGTANLNVNTNVVITAPTGASPGGPRITCAASATGTFAVTGTFTMSGNSTSTGSAVVDMLTCTMTVGGLLTINGGTNATGFAELKSSSGVITASAGMTFGSTVANAKLTTSGAGTINLVGTMTGAGTVAINANTTLAASGTVNFNTAVTLGHLTSAGTTTMGAAVTVASNLSVSGTSLTTGAFNFIVSGTTTVSSGTLSLTNDSGTKTLTGLVTLNGGTLSGASTAIITTAGITNNSGTVSITGTNTMSTAGATFGGANAISIATLTLTSPGAVTNNGTLTISTALGGTGALTNSATGTLNISFAAAPTITTLTATATGNIVNYTAAAPNCKVTTYDILNFTGSGSVTCAVTTVTNDITLSGTVSWTTGASLAVTDTVSVGNGTTLIMGGSFTLSAATLNVGGGSSGVFTGNGAALGVSGTLTIGTGAIFTSTSATLTIGDDFTNNGTFTHASGIVSFNTTNTAAITGNATTFNSILVSGIGAAKTLSFQANVIYTFAGTFTITGATSKLITLQSSVGASQWKAHFNSAQSSVTFASLTDSGCDAGSASVTLDDTSTGAANNNGTCWVFPSTTIANGTNPSNSTVAPSSTITDLDAFSVSTSSGSDSITALTVTLASGTYAGISEIRITSDNGSTLYFSAVSNPSSETVNFSGGTPIPVTSTPTQYKVRITPKTHANMTAPPGASYAVTGTVTAFTSTNSQSGTDSSSATITIDNLSTANVTAASGTVGDDQVSLSWTNPVDADFSGVVVLRATSLVASAPVEGTTYSVGNTIGSATVACVTALTSCTSSSLTGTAYHYLIFAKDTNGNYSATGVIPTGSPFTLNTTTLGNGTNPSNSTVAPSTSITDLDAFTFVTAEGSDSITALTVTLATGTYAGISEIRITSSDGSTLYFSAVTDPSSETVNFSGGTPIPATSSSTPFKIRITPKAHADMAAVPGASYAVTGTVTAFTSTDTQTGTDSSSATITIDNLSTSNVTLSSVSSGDAENSLTWINPADSDFSSNVVLRSTSLVSDVPVEGASYSVGNTIGSATVACVTATTSCIDTGLTNATAYHYKIFSLDTRGNYSTGVVPTGSPATPTLTPVTSIANGTNPSNASLAPGGSATYLDSFSLSTNIGTDSVTALTVTLANGTYAGISDIRITSDDGLTLYFAAVSNPSANTVNFSGGTPIPVTTTPTQYKVRITPKSHINMAVPPGASYGVTGTVTSFTSSNGQSGSDSSSATITIDNLSPSNVSGEGASPDDGQVGLNWTNPVDSDFSNIIILKHTSSISDAPVEGATYSVNDVIGSSTVIYVGSGTSLNDTGLVNDITLFYKIFSLDSNGNYSTGTQLSATPSLIPTTIITTGTDPASSSIAPGVTGVYLDQFTFKTNTGTDDITDLVVTTTGTDKIVDIKIYSNDLVTQYFATQDTPSGNTWSFSGGTPIPVTSTIASFRVIISVKARGLLSSGSHPITGRVSSFTSTNQQSGLDGAGTTITIDMQAPADVTVASGTAGNAQVSLSWTNPVDTDFATVVVLRSTSAVSDIPADGSSYSVGNAIGSATVACVTASTSCISASLNNDTAYHYKIFAADNFNNYASGVIPTGSPFTPTFAATTSIANGAAVTDQDVDPETSEVDLDTFTLGTDVGTDTVTALTVTLASGTYAGISEIRITSDDGSTLYFTAVADPSSSVVNFSGGTGISVTTTPTQYKVLITPKTHTNMPVPLGALYAVTGTVTSFTSTNSQSGSDSSSATITIDNLSSSNVTSASGSAGDTEVGFSWTNPTDADFSETLILQSSSAVTDAPTEGVTYIVTDVIGSSTVIYASTGTSFIDTGLTNGVAYHYKIFTVDSNGNYSVGTVPSGSPFTPNVPAPSGGGGGGGPGPVSPTPPPPPVTEQPNPTPTPTPAPQPIPPPAPQPTPVVAPTPITDVEEPIVSSPESEIKEPLEEPTTPVFEDLTKKLEETSQKLVEKTNEIVNDAAEAVTEAVTQAVETVTTGINNVADSISEFTNETVAFSRNLVSDTQDGVVTITRQIGDGIKDIASDIGTAIKNTGTAVLAFTRQVTGTITSTGKAVVDATGHAINNVAITSKKIAVNTVQGVRRTSNQIANNVSKTVSGTYKNVATATSKIAVSISGKFSDWTRSNKVAVEPESEKQPIKDKVVFRSGDLELVADQNQPIQAIVGFNFIAEIIPSQKAFSIGGTYKFSDSDGDGVWTANIKMPEVKGNFNVSTNFAYATGEKTQQSISVLIDPEGYVYENHPRGELRIENANVTLWQQNSDQKWELWNATKYNQSNPQITNKTGSYSFLAPNGTYHLEVVTKDYAKYVGEAFKLDQTNPIHQIIELKYIGQ